MIKKKYTKPIVKVAQTQYQSHLLTVSNTSTTGYSMAMCWRATDSISVWAMCLEKACRPVMLIPASDATAPSGVQIAG